MEFIMDIFLNEIYFALVGVVVIGVFCVLYYRFRQVDKPLYHYNCLTIRLPNSSYTTDNTIEIGTSDSGIKDA